MGRLNKKLVFAKKAPSSKGGRIDMSQIQSMTASDLISLKKSSKVPQESTDVLMLSVKKLPELGSVASEKSPLGGGGTLSRKMKKSQKMRARKELLLDKLSKGAQKMKAEQAAKVRRKRPLIGDLNPMKITLEAIDKVLEKDDSSSRKAPKQKKRRCILKQKKRQYEFIKNASFFEAVKRHPEYTKNPFSAISNHIENKIAAEHSQNTTEDE